MSAPDPRDRVTYRAWLDEHVGRNEGATVTIRCPMCSRTDVGEHTPSKFLCRNCGHTWDKR